MRFSFLAFAGALTACSGGGGSDYVPLGGTQSYPIRTVAIDTGATLGPQGGPGEGLGVFVEYAAGGHWHISTVCDTNLSKVACQWDIVASVPKGTLGTSFAGIDRNDQILRVDSGAIRLLFDTSTEIDDVGLLSDPGANLQVDVSLDGNYDPNYALGFVFSVSGGAVDAAGAPSNPVLFAPTSP